MDTYLSLLNEISNVFYNPPVEKYKSDQSKYRESSSKPGQNCSLNE